MFQNLANVITLEPLIALSRFGFGEIYSGGQIQSDLLLWKICHLELNYNETICGNLTLDEYNSVNDEVQEKANNFLMVQDWLQAVPPLIWCLFAGRHQGRTFCLKLIYFKTFLGSLLDKFGCKPFILMVCFGQLLGDIGIFINYIFIEYLPLEFFYIDAIFGLFGGYPIYFMGEYQNRLTIRHFLEK